MKRVVITGLGPVTPIGVGAEAFLKAQHGAQNGIRRITRFDASELSVTIAGEVDVDVTSYIERKEAKRLDRFVQLALVGADCGRPVGGAVNEQAVSERHAAQPQLLLGHRLGHLSTSWASSA